MNVTGLRAKPEYLLHHIAPDRNEALFVPSDQSLLRDLSFIDGRASFSKGPAVTIALDDLINNSVPPSGADRYIFHVAFCGSTLLARLLDQPGSALVLKEPNVLVDLSNWKHSGPDARFAPAVDHALSYLRRPWTAGEPIIVKPTNWINNLLPDIVRCRAQLHAVFVTMAPEAYIMAVLRGGRDRLAFTARTAAHLAPSCANGKVWLQAAIAATADPIGRTLNLALVALRLQEILFSAETGTRIDASAIFTDPVEAAIRASKALALDMDEATIAATVAARKTINSKAPDRKFSLAEREGEHSEIERHHGAAIKTALDWSARTLY